MTTMTETVSVATSHGVKTAKDLLNSSLRDYAQVIVNYMRDFSLDETNPTDYAAFLKLSKLQSAKRRPAFEPSRRAELKHVLDIYDYLCINCPKEMALPSSNETAIGMLAYHYCHMCGDGMSTVPGYTALDEYFNYMDV